MIINERGLGCNITTPTLAAILYSNGGHTHNKWEKKW